MNKHLIKFLLLVSLLGLTSVAAADDRWETLRAINWVENPNNHTQVGRFGELGPYQFRPGTWRMHTDKPFRQAIQREVADEVAVKHYEWIKRTLAKAGVDATPFNIAMAWNSGVDNVLKGRVPEITYDYATRVTNLVQTFKRNPAARAVAAQAPVRPAAPVFKLENHVVNFAVAHDSPKFEIVLPPEPEMPVVYTADEPMAVATAGHSFTFTTAATLTPRFSL